MSIKRLVIVQPANKTLIVNNGGGSPLDFSSAGDIVRGNASQPSNGNFLFRFTEATKVSVNGAPPVSVTTDGITYNTNIDSSGIDIIFKSERIKGDFCHVAVSDSTARKDTYLRSGSGFDTSNFGSCDIIDVGGSGSAAFRGLIKFDILADVISGVVTILDSNVWVYGSKRLSGTEKTFELYEILPPNSDWVEGTFCNSLVGNEGFSTWNRKIQDVNLPNNGVRWEGENQGGVNGCRVSGVDYIGERLANVDVSTTTDKWYAYADDSGRLNDFIKKTVLSPLSNPGFVSQISSPQPQRFQYFSGNYTTDITLRPKMNFIYEQGISGLDGSSPQYATSIGSEDTFGGS